MKSRLLKLLKGIAHEGAPDGSFLAQNLFGQKIFYALKLFSCIDERTSDDIVYKIA